MNPGQDARIRQWKREERRHLWSRIIRWTLAVILAPSAFMIPIFGAFLTLLGCILIAPDIAGWLASGVDGLLWSSRRPPPPPLYSIPETLVARGKYAEAEQAYEEIIRKYPDEVKPHVDMINIAVTRLHDLELAGRLYQRGMEALKNEDARAALTHMHDAIASRLDTQTPITLLTADQREQIKTHLDQGRFGIPRG